jgi:hypothetical protein
MFELSFIPDFNALWLEGWVLRDGDSAQLLLSLIAPHD